MYPLDRDHCLAVSAQPVREGIFVGIRGGVGSWRQAVWNGRRAKAGKTVQHIEEGPASCGAAPPTK